MLRIAASASSFAGMAVLVAGCGSSGHTFSGSTRTPITTPQAVAFAHAVNLTARDLPGWSSLPTAPEPEPATNMSDPEFARCASGAGPIRYVGRVESPQFARGKMGAHAELVTSKVVVAPMASEAARELRAINTARGHSCFARLVKPANEAGAAHLRLQGLSWSRPSTVPGGFKVRMTGTVTGLGAHRPFSIYFDVLGFAHGAAVVFLFAEGWEDPPRPSTEQRPFSLLYGRAEARKV